VFFNVSQSVFFCVAVAADVAACVVFAAVAGLSLVLFVCLVGCLFVWLFSRIPKIDAIGLAVHSNDGGQMIWIKLVLDTT